MPIKIGKSLKALLPPAQRDGIEDYLWSKSNASCHLCETKMNQASDTIEADHDEPAAGGGPTDRDNLWLAHLSCNRAKQDNPSVDVRPYLKLKAFMTQKGHVLRYDGVLEHFKIKPQPSKVSDLGDTVSIDFPDGSTCEVPVFVDTNRKGRKFRYFFVSAPRVALKNDDEVQPRSLKIGQVWAIYGDIQLNPLHEPPSCRLIPTEVGLTWLGLFDGQHKTVASWMAGSGAVTVKVYLDLTKDEANYLVNSIQAKIKKLPLSPFELSAKLAEEWMVRLDEYRSQTDPDNASEYGFIEWLDKPDRPRAKAAFEAALVRAVIASPDLAITKFVHRAGQPKTGDSLMTETQFSNKVLGRLLHTAALDEPGEQGEEIRNRERENIIRALNDLKELVFEPSAGATELTDNQLERRRRMLYQGPLAHVSDLIKSLHRQVLALEPDRAFLDKVPNTEQEAKIKEGIKRLVDHPVWFAEFELSPKMLAVRDALQKNQEVEKAFSAVGLKLGYVVGADHLPNDWMT